MEMDQVKRDFLLVMNESKRMCDFYKKSDCAGCPFYDPDISFCYKANDIINAYSGFCDDVMNWSRDHSIITNEIRLRETFGKKIGDFSDDKGVFLPTEWLEKEYKPEDNEKKEN